MNIKIAIIGCGYWGPNLIRNFYQLDDCQVSFACDIDAEKLDQIKKVYPAINVTQDYKEVLKDSSIQAVCIATPLSTHFEIARAVLLAGKDVFIEKPMTSSSKEAEELIALAKEKNRILMVDHTFVYSGVVQKIKELIDKGELGKLYYYDSERINLGLIRSDANVVLDLATHDLSIIDYLFSQKPVAVSARSFGHIYNHRSETAVITIMHEGDFVSTVRVSWLSPVKIRKVMIGGSQKMIFWDDVEADEKLRIYDKGIDIDPQSVTPFQPLYRSGDVLLPKIDQTETLKRVAEHFTYCLKERGKALTDGLSGLRVIKLVEATEQSIKERGREVKIL